MSWSGHGLPAGDRLRGGASMAAASAGGTSVAPQVLRLAAWPAAGAGAGVHPRADPARTGGSEIAGKAGGRSEARGPDGCPSANTARPAACDQATDVGRNGGVRFVLEVCGRESGRRCRRSRLLADGSPSATNGRPLVGRHQLDRRSRQAAHGSPQFRTARDRQAVRFRGPRHAQIHQAADPHLADTRRLPASSAQHGQAHAVGGDAWFHRLRHPDEDPRGRPRR